MKFKLLYGFAFCVSLAACTKREYKKHRCFPYCTQIEIEGRVIDTVNQQIANVPFTVYFINIPSAWIQIFPVKDKIICSGVSDQNGIINEKFSCDRKKLNDDYAVYISFDSGSPFVIDSVPTAPVSFKYYIR